MQWLYDLKLFVVDQSGLAKDALHIYVALAVFFGASLVFGWKARDGKALMVVLLVALLNEVADIRFNLAIEDDPFWFESVRDLVNTMAVPVLIVALARWTTVFGSPDPAGKPATGPGSGDEA